MRALSGQALGSILAVFAGMASHSQDTALPDALAAGWEGVPVCELQHETATHRILRCTFPPGIGHVRHFHPAHYGYALTGGTMRLTSEVGTQTANIEAGSGFSSEGVAWHEVVNVGETTVTYLIVEQR